MTSLPSAIRSVGEPAPLQAGAVRAPLQAGAVRAPIQAGAVRADIIEAVRAANAGTRPDMTLPDATRLVHAARYGRAKLAPHVGGTPMRGYGEKGESSGVSKEEKEELLAKDEANKKSNFDKTTEVMDKGGKLLSGAANSMNQISGALQGAAAITSAITEGGALLTNAIDNARKTDHQINRENGKLEKEIAENAAKRAEQVNNMYDDLRAKRWFKFGSFSPPSLDLKKFRITKDEIWKYERDGKLPESAMGKIEKANEAVYAYVLKARGLNDELQTKNEVAALKKAKEDAKLARLEFKKLVAAAQKEGIDVSEAELEGDGVKRPNMRGCGAMSHARSIRAIYPNPDMMSGMMSK